MSHKSLVQNAIIALAIGSTGLVTGCQPGGGEDAAVEEAYEDVQEEVKDLEQDTKELASAMEGELQQAQEELPEAMNKAQQKLRAKYADIAKNLKDMEGAFNGDGETDIERDLQEEWAEVKQEADEIDARIENMVQLSEEQFAEEVSRIEELLNQLGQRLTELGETLQNT